jgi:hypothetical protein
MRKKWILLGSCLLALFVSCNHNDMTSVISPYPVTLTMNNIAAMEKIYILTGLVDSLIPSVDYDKYKLNYALPNSITILSAKNASMHFSYEPDSLASNLGIHHNLDTVYFYSLYPDPRYNYINLLTTGDYTSLKVTGFSIRTITYDSSNQRYFTGINRRDQAISSDFLSGYLSQLRSLDTLRLVTFEVLYTH